MKNKRFIQRIALTSVFAVLVFMSFIDDNAGAQNILMFWIWLEAVISLVFISPDAKKLAKDKGRKAPQWLTCSAYIFTIIIVIWHGWIFTGAACLFTLLMREHVFSDPESDELVADKVD